MAARTLNILSLCTGGAGLDLGVELAIPSARTVCMVEREAFACAQLVSAMEAGTMAPAPIWSDARTFNGRPWRGIVDGLIGGIPCQPHSLAGNRQGEEDERDLWSTARKLIVQSGAWFVLIENVRGMLSSGGAERVWRDLRRLGFTVEGGLFTASEVGATHERERIFILAVADDAREQGGHRSVAGRRFGGDVSDRGRRFELADTDKQQGRGQHEFGSGGGAGARQQSGRNSGELADAGRSGLEGNEFGGASGKRHRSEAPRPTAEFRGAPVLRGEVVDAPSIRRRERRTKPELRSGRSAATGASAELGHTPGLLGADVPDRHGSAGQYVGIIDRPAGGNGDGRSAERDLSGQREDAAPTWFRPLFPPGPADMRGWERVLDAAPKFEPAVRRVVNGVATELDVSRVDRLRMLGNGVVPLQAAYALRTLANRLAKRGSAGATRLIRLMGDLNG